MKPSSRTLFAVVVLGLLVTSGWAAISLIRPTAEDTAIPPANKQTPDPLATTVESPLEPPVLIPAFVPTWGRLITSTILIIAGAVVIVVIILYRRRGENS